MKTYIQILSTDKYYSIRNTNINVENMFYNYLNDFYENLQINAFYYTELLDSNAKNYKIELLIVILVCYGLSILFTILTNFFLTSVDKDRSLVLGVFFEIPAYFVDRLSDRCLKFIEKSEKIGGDESDNGEYDVNEEISTKTSNLLNDY